MCFFGFRPGAQAIWRVALRPNRIGRTVRAGLSACALGIALVVPAAAEQPQPVTYTVQAGDTLLNIAQQFSVPAGKIAAANDLTNPNKLAIGQTLTINPNNSTQSMVTSSLPPLAAHYPSFTILPGGMVVRTLTTVPPVPDILDAPYHSQFDGTIWAESDCGPTSLSMALGALGIDVPQLTLRHYADQQMGMADPNSGTTWESLAYAAKTAGANVEGLYGDGQSYRVWSIDDLKQELSMGHPVLLLVRYWDLPGHASSSYSGDHYIVGLGFDHSGNLVFNDPATYGNGSDLTISQSALTQAWSDTSVGLVRTAMAVYR